LKQLEKHSTPYQVNIFTADELLALIPAPNTVNK